MSPPPPIDTDTEERPDPAFRLKSAARIRAGWLQSDLMFLTRSLRYLLRPQGEGLRRAAGLEPGEIGILAVVGLNPGVSQNDLAASVVLKKSAVTRLVQDLERRGLLVRARSTTDRRANCLHLTPGGEAVIARVRQETRAMQDGWFDGVDPAARAIFLEVLSHLVARLADTAAPETGQNPRRTDRGEGFDPAD